MTKREFNTLKAGSVLNFGGIIMIVIRAHQKQITVMYSLYHCGASLITNSFENSDVFQDTKIKSL